MGMGLEQLIQIVKKGIENAIENTRYEQEKEKRR